MLDHAARYKFHCVRTNISTAPKSTVRLLRAVSDQFRNREIFSVVVGRPVERIEKGEFPGTFGEGRRRSKMKIYFSNKVRLFDSIRI